jgi:hypothetical protein
MPTLILRLQTCGRSMRTQVHLQVLIAARVPASFNVNVALRDAVGAEVAKDAIVTLVLIIGESDASTLCETVDKAKAVLSHRPLQKGKAGSTQVHFASTPFDLHQQDQNYPVAASLLII